MKKGLSRRSFLKGMAAGAVSVGAMGLTSGIAEEAACKPDITWDYETDVVIVGYGASGMTAALTAVEEGIEAIVLEKSPIADGGNFGCSTGQIQSSLLPNDPEEEIEKWKHFNYGGVPADEADKLYRALQEQEMSMPYWLEDLGLELKSSERDYGDPSRAIGTNWWSSRGDGGGAQLWGNFLEIAEEYGVDVRLGTPAKKLIQDPHTKEILGVTAMVDGVEKNFKARKGVIMACGGFENNFMMQNWYTEFGVNLWTWGTPYNTGDGITMCSAVGAQMWHMAGVEWGNLCYRLPSESIGCAVTTDNNTLLPYPGYNFLLVNKAGKRYINETQFFSHQPKYGHNHQTYTSFDLDTYEFKNLPFWLIFDQNAFEAGPIYGGSTRLTRLNSYCGVHGLMADWTNEGAVEKGWIVKADTIEELAAKIKGTTPSGTVIEGLDPAALAETVNAFNGYASAGSDPEFGRSAETMAPLTGPFYAIEMALTTINTQGGPKRNENLQTLDAFNHPIPRLYNVGQFGSLNAGCYNIGNIAEALTTGRYAMLHAKDLENWDA